MSHWLADFTPIAGLTFRDARPFQAGENRAAAALPFPPPPGAFWTTVASLTGRARTGQTRQVDQPIAGGLWLWNGTDYLFPMPLDVVEAPESLLRLRETRRWTLLRPERLPATRPHTLWPPLRAEAGEMKAVRGLLRSDGLVAYLNADTSSALPTVPASAVMTTQTRVGTALEGRNGIDGRMYTEPVMFLNRGLTPDENWIFRMPLEFTRAPQGATNDLVRLGGEARHARMRLGSDESFPRLSSKIRQVVQQAVLAGHKDAASVRIKLVFLTPAVFSAKVALMTRGAPAWRPWWLPEQEALPMRWLNGASLELNAAIVGRPFPLGAWDSGAAADAESSSGPGGPKPLYRAVPAGSVYYLTLRTRKGTPVDNAIEKLFTQLWFKTLHVDRHGNPTYFGRAGFGVVVVGGWDEF